MLKESELKMLMPRLNEQLGLVAIMNPAVQLVTGQAAEGTTLQPVSRTTQKQLDSDSI